MRRKHERQSIVGDQQDEGDRGTRNSSREEEIRGSSKKSSSSKCKQSEKETEPPVFRALAPLIVKSWSNIDVDDEDGDDYYGTTAPIQSNWGSEEPSQSHEDNNVNLEVT